MKAEDNQAGQRVEKPSPAAGTDQGEDSSGGGLPQTGGARKRSWWGWLLGAGLAITGVELAIFSSGGARLALACTWLVLVFLLVIRKVARNRPGFSIRVHPGVALLVLTVIGGLVAAELGVRVFLPERFRDFEKMYSERLGYQYDRTLGWFPVPNSRETGTVNGRQILMAHNSEGFRDPEPVLDERPGIVFLGDSFLWGYHVDQTERFTTLLRARHPEWRLYNLGVAGYGTDQEYLLLQREFARYHPQLVFLVFCVENDHIDNRHNGGGQLAFKPYFTIGGNELELHGVPVPESGQVFCLKHPVLSKSWLIRLAMQAWGNLRSPPAPPGEDPTVALVGALRRYTEDHGAKFCVGLNGKDPEVEKFLHEAKIPFVDLSTSLRIKGGFHWSAEGHAFVAKRIEEFLVTGPGGKLLSNRPTNMVSSFREDH